MAPSMRYKYLRAVLIISTNFVSFLLVAYIHRETSALRKEILEFTEEKYEEYSRLLNLVHQCSDEVFQVV